MEGYGDGNSSFGEQRLGDRYLVEVGDVSGAPVNLSELLARLNGLNDMERVRVYQEHFYHGRQEWLPVRNLELLRELAGREK